MKEKRSTVSIISNSAVWRHHSGRGLLFSPLCTVHLLLLLLSRQVVSNSLQPQGQLPARLLCPWEFPGKNTGVGCHFLVQRTFLTQGLNPSLLLGRWILLPLSHLGSSGSALARNKTLTAPEETLYNLRLSLWIGDFKQLIHNTK